MVNIDRSLEIFEELSPLDATQRVERIKSISDTEPAEVSHALQLLGFEPDNGAMQGADTEQSNESDADVRLFGNYELIQCLGTGSQGAVWSARRLGTEKTVALKILNQSSSPDLTSNESREVQGAPRLRHNNIVWVTDCGEHRGQSFIEMQYVDAQPLQKYAPAEGLSPIRTAELMMKIVGAIEFVHHNRVTHRDVKPQNILVDTDGEPYLTDFGIARIGDDPSTITLEGVVHGTPSYMSPEQARGDDVDPSTDVYSLGAVLYFLLTNRPPFQEDTVEETKQKVIREFPIPPRRWNPKVPRDLETICLKCLNKKRDGRYASATELRKDLWRFTQGQPIEGRRPTPAERGLNWIQNHYLHVSVGTVILLGLVLSAILNQQRRQSAAMSARFGEHLNQAMQHRDAGQWQGAIAELERAETLVGHAGISPPMQMEVKDLRSDVETAIELTQLRERIPVVNMNQGGTPPNEQELRRLATQETELYHNVFAGYGIDLRNQQPDDVFRLIRESPIRDELVKGLDNWSLLEFIPHARLALLVIAQEADANKFRKQIRTAIMRDDPQQVIELLSGEDLIAYPPESLECAAMAVARSGRTEDAIELMQRAVLHHSGDPWLNFALGSLYMMADRPDQALTFRRVSVALRPENAELRLNLGAVLYGLERYEEAIAEFRRAVTLKPDYASAWENIALALEKLGRVEEARKAYETAGELNPGSGSAKKDLGFLFLNDLGDPQTAETHFLDALAAGEESADLRVGLGMSLERQQQLESAETQLRRALELDPNHATAHQRLGVVLAKQQQFSKSRVELERTIELNSDDPDTHYNLAMTCLSLNDTAAAIPAFQRSVELDPSNATAHYNLAMLYRENRDSDAAIAALTAAAAAKPDWPDAHVQLAVELAGAGRQQEANVSMARAAELRPQDADILGAYGAALCQADLFDQARIVLEDCLRQNPDHPIGTAYLGLTYWQLSELKRADETLRKALLLVPEPLAQQLGLNDAAERVSRLAALEGQLTQIAQQKVEPESNQQRLDFAELCYRKRLFAAAASHFESALDSSPELAADPTDGRRYNAACCAALAGCGEGADAEELSEQQRASWRAKSLTWLKASKASIEENESLNPQARRGLLAHWLRDNDLAAVREPQRLDSLPVGERAAWIEFWDQLRASLEESQ